MDNSPRMAIRKLLKNFGIRADEAIIAHLAANPDRPPLNLRITLTDMTDYGDAPPEPRLAVEVQGVIQQAD